jgi:hypothetical protein
MNHSCLQIWSEWSTIIGTILTVLLTLIVIYLTVRDRQKSESIRELKEQTKTLHSTFIELIKPNFTVDEIISNSYIFIFNFHYKNVGGHCYNLTIPDIQKLKEDWIVNLLETESLSSQSGNIGSIEIPHEKFIGQKEYSIEFNFSDVEGRKYSQTLVFKSTEDFGIKNIFFKPPVRME